MLRCLCQNCSQQKTKNIYVQEIKSDKIKYNTIKKEILAGLIVIVAIASIAIFVVTPSMSISFEIDGKQTSDEMELLFPGSGDDDYQEYKYVSEKFEKSRIYASAGGAEVYEAGFGGDFLNWLRDLFSGWLNDAIVDVNEAFPIDDVNPEDTDPDVVIEDIGDLVEDEKVGDPGPTPEAVKVIGEYVGPKELIIDGELSEKERKRYAGGNWSWRDRI